VPKGQRATYSMPSQTIAKAPNWTTLPKPNITYIYADHRVNTDIDANGVGRVQVKPGYNVNVEDIRYDYDG
jgi:hypothetical protein